MIYFALMSVAGAALGLQILGCREAQAFDSPFEAFLFEKIHLLFFMNREKDFQI